MDRLADDMFLRLIFSTRAVRNGRSAITAQVSFVAGICQAQRSQPNGIEPHGALCAPNDEKQWIQKLLNFKS